MKSDILMEKLNAPTAKERLEALREIKGMYDAGELEMPVSCGNVNNHIHTTYSFSPYSPTKAAYLAWLNGLTTAGIMDHDSVSGCLEFVEAGKILGIATTIGMECRVSVKKFADRRLNNPDQDGVAYCTIHGIPHQSLPIIESFISPLREKRNIRNRKMVDNLNALLAKGDICIDFDKDVTPLSNNHEGGSVTERHLLFAVAHKIVERFGQGKATADFVENGLGVKLSEKQRKMLEDTEYPYYAYDLLGVLKSDLVEKFYIPATDECADVADYIEVCRKAGAVSAYAYLGDVGDSVTGDKKTQKFEDDYLDELVDYVKELGFNAITYMPSRNTLPQLERVMELCRKHGLFQISGEDINSPRQSFKNDKVASEPFKHLVTATWALIGHEMSGTNDIESGMFSDTTCKNYPDINDRVTKYAQIGKDM